MNDISKAILSTLAYYDMFDYPLTELELWQWLYQPGIAPVKLSDLRAGLISPELSGKVKSHNGFYFLSGRREIVDIRLDRYRSAERKFGRALKFIKFFRCFPFVRMIAVCNTLAINNSRPNADIDLFIVAKANRVWQTRFWLTLFLRIFNLRPSQSARRDKICASFFVDENNLNLASLSLAKDIYLPYWVSQLVPVYDEKTYDSLLAANSWVREQIPNFLINQLPQRRTVKRSGGLKKIIEFKLSILPENFFRSLQWRILPARLKKLANQGTEVIWRTGVLKFHDNDRRRMFYEKWQIRLQGLVKFK